MNATETLREFHNVAKICFLATCDKDRPRVRPMVAAAVEDGAIYFETHAGSPKIAQLGDNANVEVTWVKPDWSHLRARGKAELVEDPETRQRVWNGFQEGKDYFDSADAPELAVVKISVSEVLHMPLGAMGYEPLPS